VAMAEKDRYSVINVASGQHAHSEPSILGGRAVKNMTMLTMLYRNGECCCGRWTTRTDKQLYESNLQHVLFLYNLPVATHADAQIGMLNGPRSIAQDAFKDRPWPNVKEFIFCKWHSFRKSDFRVA
jgi:hypothetical protein